MWYNERMKTEFKRPERKDASAKVSEEDMIYFSLGIDRSEFILPSQRQDYHSDMRAVQLVRAVQDGKKLSHQDFSGINLKGADISGGIFNQCNFKGAVFYKTNAETADFTDCCFDEAYMEGSNFTGCDFTGASFRRTFSKNNKWEKAFRDAESEKYLTAVEQIIRLIEEGKLDIRTIAKTDLINLDIRRLDFSKIDLEDLDLSMFALDGINLLGTYIDPKQLMSLEGWNSYCLDLRKTKEITRERLCRKVMTEQQEALARYANTQKKIKDDIRTKKLTRPLLKTKETEETRGWGIEKARAEFKQMQEKEVAERQRQEQEEAALYATYKQEYTSKTDGSKATSQSPVSVPNTSNQTDKMAVGIPVTKESIRFLDSELKTRPAFGIVSQEIKSGKGSEPAVSDLNAPNPVQSNASEHQVNDKKEVRADLSSDQASLNLSKPDRNEKSQPVVIVAHDEAEKQQAISAEEVANKQINTSAGREDEEIKSSTRQPQARYRYFQMRKEAETQEEPILQKPESDDEEETVHDLKNAGLSTEEIADFLRKKGPLKVMGKLPKGRKVNHKTKG